MGSMICLSVGRLEVDWGKNQYFKDHSFLFQESDVKDVPYYYVDSAAKTEDEQIITEYKEGYSKLLIEVIDRLKLSGHTLAFGRREFAYLSKLNGFELKKFSFKH